MQVVAGVEDALMVRRRALARSQGRRRLMLLLALAAAIVGIGGYWVLRASSAFEVTGVKVAGAPPGLTGQIQSAVAAEAHGHSLLGMDASSIARRVEQIPFVRTATVDRAFPHTLAVHVQVYHPRAYATIGGQGYLIAADGRVLGTARKQPLHVAGVSLPDGTTLSVGSSTGDENVAAALSVLSASTPAFVHDVGRITQLLPRSGTITAVVDRHIQLRFGAPEGLAEKMAVVERVMRRIQGPQRTNMAYLDVSAPGRPALGMRTTSV